MRVSTTILLYENMLSKKNTALEENVNAMAIHIDTGLSNTLDYSHVNEHRALFNYLRRLYTHSTLENSFFEITSKACS